MNEGRERQVSIYRLLAGAVVGVLVGLAAGYVVEKAMGRDPDVGPRLGGLLGAVLVGPLAGGLGWRGAAGMGLIVGCSAVGALVGYWGWDGEPAVGATGEPMARELRPAWFGGVLGAMVGILAFRRWGLYLRERRERGAGGKG